MALSNAGVLTDQDIAQLDKPLSDSEVAMFDAGQASAPKAPPKPPDPPQIQIQQQFQAKRQQLDRQFAGMAKANKIASYGVPAGVLTDSQAARYNQEVARLGQQEQQALASVPPQPPPMGPPPIPAKDGVKVGRTPRPYARNGKSLAGPQTVLAGEAGNELLIHNDGSQELLDHPQLRQLGTQGTDQVLPLTRPAGPKEILRGTSNIPLDEQGQQEAALNGRRYAGQFDQILAGPLLRTQQTADALRQSNPQAQFSLDPNFKDMGLGQLEGQQVTIPAIEQINNMVLREPDMPFQGQGPMSTGPGDSFNGFKNRVIGGLTRVMAQHAANPGLRTGIVTHNRVLRVVKGWEQHGFSPDGKIDTDPLIHYNKGASPPGSVEHLSQNPATGQWQLRQIAGEPSKGPDGKIDPGIYLIRHGRTQWNSSGKVG